MSKEAALPKVLVSYVNPLDANAQIALGVAEQLCRHGVYVELRPVSRARPASVYRAVVLGGAIDDQHWDRAALAYLEQYGGRPGRLWLYHTRFDSGSVSPGLPPPEVLKAVDSFRVHPVPTFGCPFNAAAGQLTTTVKHPHGLEEMHEAARRWASGIARGLTEGDIVVEQPGLPDRRVDALVPC